MKRVKSWVYGLKDGSREYGDVLAEYGKRWGEKGREYVEDALPRWRSGRTKIGGRTLARFVTLIPEHAPYGVKLEITGEIWRWTAGREAEEREVEVKDTLEGLDKVSRAWEDKERDGTIPERVKEEVKWLAGEDVKLYERLLQGAMQGRAETVRKRATDELVAAFHRKSRMDVQRVWVNTGTGSVRVEAWAREEAKRGEESKQQKARRIAAGKEDAAWGRKIAVGGAAMWIGIAVIVGTVGWPGGPGKSGEAAWLVAWGIVHYIVWWTGSKYADEGKHVLKNLLWLPGMVTGFGAGILGLIGIATIAMQVAQ